MTLVGIPYSAVNWRTIRLLLVAVMIAVPITACTSTPDRYAIQSETPEPTATVTRPSESIAVPPSPTATVTPELGTTSVEPTPTPAIEGSRDDEEPESAESADGGDDSIIPDDLDLAGFAATIDELIGDVDGLIEVVVARPDAEVVYERNSSEPMEAASLYKLAIMVEMFRLRELGELTFDDTILLLPDYFIEEDEVFSTDRIGDAVDLGSLLTYMISFSSNVAAAALLARTGNENVNATMASLGFTGTEIRWTPGIWVSMERFEAPVPEDAGPAPEPEPLLPVDPVTGERSRRADPGRNLLAVSSPSRPSVTAAEQNNERVAAAMNVTTAADIGALLLRLVNGTLISPTASMEMLELLENQVVTDRLPVKLPEGTITAHKTGNWEGLVHDAGVIWAPSGPIVVVVMTDIQDEGRAVEIISSIALAAYILNS